MDGEHLERVSTRSGKLGIFRGFQGTQRDFGVPFPTPGTVSRAQSLFICPDSVYGSDGASAPPWTLQSSLGIPFRAFYISAVLARCDSLSWSRSRLCPCPSAAALWVFGDCSLCPTLPNVPNPLSGSGKPFPCVLTLYPLSQIPLHVTIKSQSFSCPGPALIFSTPFSRAALCHLGKHCRN